MRLQRVERHDVLHKRKAAALSSGAVDRDVHVLQRTKRAKVLDQLVFGGRVRQVAHKETRRHRGVGERLVVVGVLELEEEVHARRQKIAHRVDLHGAQIVEFDGAGVGIHVPQAVVHLQPALIRNVLEQRAHARRARPKVAGRHTQQLLGLCKHTRASEHTSHTRPRRRHRHRTSST